MTFDPPSFVRRLQHRERALVAARPYDKSLPRALERPDSSQRASLRPWLWRAPQRLWARRRSRRSATRPHSPRSAKSSTNRSAEYMARQPPLPMYQPDNSPWPSSVRSTSRPLLLTYFNRKRP